MKTWMTFTCLFLFMLTALAACTTPPPTATPDIPATVAVQVQDRLAAIPTATPAPTYTPYPTPTTAPTATPYPTATPRPTYTLYPTPTSLPTATLAPEVAWKTVSDDAGTYTIDLPDYWILDSVEMYEDGKSSFTTWSLSDNSEASISIEAVYSEYGFNATSATASKIAFDETVSSADTVVVEGPGKVLDGWRYVVERLSGDGTCTLRAYEYWEIRYKWAFVVHARTCLRLLDTYVAEVTEALFSFESTAYGKR